MAARDATWSPTGGPILYRTPSPPWHTIQTDHDGETVTVEWIYRHSTELRDVLEMLPASYPNMKTLRLELPKEMDDDDVKVIADYLAPEDNMLKELSVNVNYFHAGPDAPHGPYTGPLVQALYTNKHLRSLIVNDGNVELSTISDMLDVNNTLIYIDMPIYSDELFDSPMWHPQVFNKIKDNWDAFVSNLPRVDELQTLTAKTYLRTAHDQRPTGYPDYVLRILDTTQRRLDAMRYLRTARVLEKQSVLTVLPTYARASRTRSAEKLETPSMIRR